MTETWHVRPEEWRAYAAGTLDEAAACAVDAHVRTCAPCGGAAAAHVRQPDLDLLWRGVLRQVRRPQPSRLYRLLRIARLSERDALLLTASSGLGLAWAVAFGAAVVCAVVTGFVPRRQDLTFLLVAPLVPVLAVVAVQDAADPLRELLVPTAYSKLRLATLRAAAVLAVALPSTASVGLLVPGLQGFAVAWMLPGLLLTATCLVALTWLPTWSAGAFVISGWVAAVSSLYGGEQLDALAGGPAQAVLAAATGLMCLLLVVRTSTSRLRGGF